MSNHAHLLGGLIIYRAHPTMIITRTLFQYFNSKTETVIAHGRSYNFVHIEFVVEFQGSFVFKT